jgi:uncharacterized protein (DUF608 family)
LAVEAAQRLITAFKAAAAPAATQEVWEDAVEDEDEWADSSSDDEEILDDNAEEAAAVPEPAAAPAEAQDDVWHEVRWCVNLCMYMQQM